MRASIAADVATVGRISAVPTILEMVSAATGLRFAAVARVTETSWTACAVLDKIDFGLAVGGELDVTTTLCREIHASREPIVIEKASDDLIYCGHPTPKQYGFQSYLAVPIIRRGGEVFGTICALDPEPATLKDAKTLTMVQLFAELISAQLEVEERLEASQTALTSEIETGGRRDQFIAVLGHDLRNPLATIMAGVQLLSRQTLDEKGAFVLEQMRQSGTRMAGLVNDILDFARGHLGGGIPVRRRLVTDLADQLARILGESRVTHPDRVVEADLAIDEPVFCDPDRLLQLFSNLLANALAHGAADRPVRVVARSAGDGFSLAVTNQGPAIPPSVMDTLFQPYTQAISDKPKVGLGLGLYIAAEIARAHEGRLDVRSSDEEGTTVTFTIPAKDSPRRMQG